MENKFNVPCTDLTQVFMKHGFPLNIHLYRRKIVPNDSTDDGDNFNLELHCVQSSQEVSVYTVIDANGKERSTHLKSFNHVYYVALKTELIFNSLSEIYTHFCCIKKRKQKCSKWAVCLKTFSCTDGVVLLRRGQVFKLVNFKNRGGTSCNTNSTNRSRAKILMYGSKDPFWIPFDLKGQFRLCETDPSTKNCRNDMATITQKHDFPILVRDNENSNSFHCILNITTEKYFISCTESRQIAVLPAKSVLLKDVLQSQKPLSSLSQQELQSVEAKAFSNKYFEDEREHHYTGTFKEFGIFRKPEIGLPPIPLDHSEAEEKSPTLKPLPPVPTIDYPVEEESRVVVKPEIYPKPKIKERGKPPVPMRHPRHSLKLSQAKARLASQTRISNENVTEYSNNNDSVLYRNYLCTPILDDPDDTDPDENDESEQMIPVHYDDVDSFTSDDDYENQPRILVHLLTK